MFLLDTHALIWFAEGEERHIGRRTTQLLQRAASAGLVRISPINLFEVTTLHVLGRVRFTRSLDEWIRETMETSNARVAEVTATVAIDGGHIPRTALPDPMDRLLVATARQLDATFVTADRAILAYAREGHVRVHDASR